MKRFLAFSGLALVLTVILTLSLLPFNTSAAEVSSDNNVIYISDLGTGDGSSAQNALGNSTHPDFSGTENYMNTALYQAFEKLATTGGTVVICGDVKIGTAQCEATGSASIAEFKFPKTKKPILVTSVYKNEDYLSTAKFISAENSFLLLNGPTVWENLNIYSNGNSDRAICCNGYKTVFGEGLNCTAPSGSSSNMYLSIAGGTRYADLASDTDITVKSGKFCRIAGGIWTHDNSQTHTLTGDTHIRIEGGTVTTMIFGNATYAKPSSGIAAPNHDGDVYLTITGGNIDAQIYAAGVGAFKNADSEVFVKIEGGFFSSARTTPIIATYSGNTGYAPANIYIDLANSSNVTRNENLNRLINNLPANGKIVNYPSHWATSVTKISAPSVTTVFKNDVITSEGAEVSVTYTDKHVTTKTYTDTVKYEDAKSAFKVVCDTSTIGQKSIEFQYGNKTYATSSITVLDAPTVNIEGAQIRVDSATQQLRFVANFDNSLADGMTVDSYGIIAVPSDMLNSKDAFNHVNTVGMYDYQPGEKDINVTAADITRFSAIAVHYIRQNNYCTDYTARAYVKVTYGGESYYRYSDIIERNPYIVAKQAIKNDDEPTEYKEALKANLIDVYDSYDEYTSYNDSSYLRDKVVAYMETMANYAWQPEETFLVLNPSSSGVGSSVTALFEKGKTYYGLPYVNDNLNQYESFVEHFKTENGVNYFTDPENKITPLTGSYFIYDHDTYYLTDAQKEAAFQNYLNMPGNDCITALLLSWNSVLNNRDDIQNMISTYSVIPGHDTGVIPVGDYEYSYEKYGYDTPSMVNATGETRMYAAYAKLQKGDGLITLNTSTNVRHARLVVKVDVNAQTVTTREQATTHITGRNDNYTTMPEKTYTFKQLFDTAYLPITIPELTTGNSDTEFTYATDLDLVNTLPDKKLSGTVMSNRQIIYVRVIVNDENGNEIYNAKSFLPISGYSFHAREYDLSTFDLGGLTLTSGNKYSISILTKVSGLKTLESEVPLLTDYSFTAK